jgi:hypothetical protein
MDDAELDDAGLEQAMRDGLERRAQRADTAVPVADRARTDVRRRRAGRVTAGLAAAAVVVAGLTTVALDRDDRAEPGPGGPPVASDTVSPIDAVWRTEYWRDMQVDVPNDWGWGGAPFRLAGRLVICGGPASDDAHDGPGYVGRPIMLSDVCGSASEAPVSGPYVWLGSALEPGTRDLADGYVEETVEVNGSRLTVATDDASLRERILSSAQGSELCASELAGPPRPSGMLIEGIGRPLSTKVCVYRRMDGVLGLAHGREFGAAETRALVGAVHAGKPTGFDCDAPGDLWVIIAVTGEPDGVGSGGTETWVVSPECRQVITDAGTLDLAPAMVAPWADGGASSALGSVGRGESLMDYLLAGGQG